MRWMTWLALSMPREVVIEAYKLIDEKLEKTINWP